MDDMLVTSEEGLQTLINDCRPQEQYTFLMEALCNEMPNEVKTKAIVLLKTAILGIKAEKRYMYLSSCLPTLLKRCATCENPKDASQEAFVQRLEALKDLALIFPQASKELDIEDEEERARKKMQGKVMQSMVSSFLLKLLQKAFPILLPVKALDLEADKELKLLHPPHFRESNIDSLCHLATAAASSSPRPILALFLW